MFASCSCSNSTSYNSNPCSNSTSYNPNPYCWQHTIGHPWRGPTAKPKY